jgi:hypothetical protein
MNVQGKVAPMEGIIAEIASIQRHDGLHDGTLDVYGFFTLY